MNSFIQIAIEEAKKAANAGEVPVGAVVVLNGEVIAKAANRVMQDKDASGHAELVAVRAACEKLESEQLVDCDLYTTLEPCVMCAGMLSLARIKRLYYGASDEKRGGVFWFDHETCHHKPEIYGGIAESECGELVRDFFGKLR